MPRECLIQTTRPNLVCLRDSDSIRIASHLQRLSHDASQGIALSRVVK